MADPDGKPLNNAAVVLFDEEQPSSTPRSSSVTDDKGQFSITKLQGGTYEVRVIKNGYVSTQRQEVHVRIAQGQDLKGILIHVVSAGVITGHVVDEKGEPVVSAEVVASLKRSWTQKRSFGGRAETDDRGDFRIFGLHPGRYIVAVQPYKFGNDAQEVEDLAGSKSELDYVTTYYPGTTVADEATVIHVSPGQEAIADFGLQKMRTVSVSGKVLNTAGGIVDGGAVWLKSADRSRAPGAAPIREGRFTVKHVPPGEYALSAFTGTPDPTEPQLSGTRKIIVGENGISNLLVQIGLSPRIKGRVVADSKPAPKYERLSVDLVSSDFSTNQAFEDASDVVANVKPDGTFETQDIMPGTYHVSVSADSSELEDWYLESAILGSQDVTDSGIRIEGNARNLTLDLIISSNGATITGAVHNEKGVPVANATVVAVPPLKQRKRLDLFQQAYSDQNGRFVLYGVAPDEYQLFAWQNIDPNAIYDPDLISKYEAQAKKIHVAAEQDATVDLNAISLPADDY